MPAFGMVLSLLCMLPCLVLPSRSLKPPSLVEKELKEIMSKEMSLYLAENIRKLYPNLENMASLAFANTTGRDGIFRSNEHELCRVIFQYFEKGLCRNPMRSTWMKYACIINRYFNTTVNDSLFHDFCTKMTAKHSPSGEQSKSKACGCAKIATTARPTTHINIYHWSRWPKHVIFDKVKQRRIGKDHNGEDSKTTVTPKATTKPGIPPLSMNGVTASYYFLAVNTVAKAVRNAHKLNCLNKRGTFDASKLTCRLPQISKQNSVGIAILSIIGNSCSIICLLILTITYFIFKKEFTLMDRNITCLSTCLAFAHLLELNTIFFNETRIYCKISGILLHWSLLASFLWMATISFDIFITFRKTQPIDHTTAKRRFKTYCFFVFTTSISIVVLCMFLGMPKGDFTGYGYQSKCFIAKMWANLFAFTLPVAIILIFNTSLMILTIYKLRSREREYDHALTQNDNQDTARKKLVVSVLTLKLSVLFGLGWLFGFITGLTSNVAPGLQIIFFFVASFQGTFVFLAFGNHKPLFDCCHKKLQDRKNGYDIAGRREVVGITTSV